MGHSDQPSVLERLLERGLAHRLAGLHVEVARVLVSGLALICVRVSSGSDIETLFLHAKLVD